MNRPRSLVMRPYRIVAVGDTIIFNFQFSILNCAASLLRQRIVYLSRSLKRMSFRGNEVTVGIRFPKSADCHVATLLAMTR